MSTILRRQIYEDRLAYFSGNEKKARSMFANFGRPGLKYMSLYSKADFFQNKNKLIAKYYFLRKRFYGEKFGLQIGTSLNGHIGNGFKIVHNGLLIIHGSAIIGDHVTVHQGVFIGQGINSSEDVPKIGNDVYIAPGAKILGNVKIADNVTIGANSVVTHDIIEPGVTVAGAPAVIIGRKSVVATKKSVKKYE